MSGLLKQEKEFELAVEPDGNIVCFRYRPDGFTGDLNKLTAFIRKKITDDAGFYVVQTSVGGQIYLFGLHS